ncbi:AbiV family abortive infection protein [Bradyrhizobium sp. Pear77]|uniref:AbiV family abortive infection protein n=1 Tax=Bradyrhizobium altum TaxID=1571202 RepID=UPI001E3BFE69|nr:AbiV family abortive infection protein [Bradyrhizobium altum]MCC8957268.1 AbiV family abortive infection protein [Bradyrhizobium altum]
MMNALSKDQALSIAEISTAMGACLANSQELLEEAALLVEAGHTARAFFLYYTASEELAKFFIFEAAGKRVALGDPPNWRRFWQRFRSHDSKLAHIEVRARIPLRDEKPEDHELALTGLDLLSSYGALPRNTTLYVDLDPNHLFRKPSDIDWTFALPSIEALARHLLHSAKQGGDSPDAIARAIQQEPSETSKKHALRTLEHAVVRLKASGIEKDELLKRLDKFLR